MAHAYTPGLKVTERMILSKHRILPLKGDVLVKVGDIVTPETIVARTLLPGDVEPINVANKLGLPPEDLEMAMKVKEGDTVKAGDILAETKTLIFFKNSCTATIDGTIESISHVTGQVLQRGEPSPVEVKAYINGKVTEIIENEGAVVTTSATFVQGIFGIGGETSGEIMIVTPDNQTILSDDLINDSMKGKVIIGGSLVTSDALKKAIKVGAKGIVVGGFDDKDLRDFLGYDIGVAITGSEKIDITLVVTEGFGPINMAHKTFDLLKAHEGETACINGATQIRAGVIRPEVIIPAKDVQEIVAQGEEEIMGLAIGSPVRVIRHPYFGKLGNVSNLPSPLHQLESESKARILEVEFEDGVKAIVPRANVEMIES